MGAGGLGTLIGDAGRSLARKFMPAAEDTITKSESALNDVVGAKDAYFKAGGLVGEKVQQLHMSYQEARAQALSKLDAPINEAQKQVLAHPTLRNGAGLDAPVKDLYLQAQSINHPLAQPGGVLDKIVMQSKGNELKSLNALKNQNIQHARVLASAEIFGDKLQNVIPYIMPMLQSKDPVQESWAKGVMNLISNETKDTTTHLDNGAESLVSSAKLHVANEVGRQNLATRTSAIARGIIKKDASGSYNLDPIRDNMIRPFDTSPTYYPPKGIPGEIESRMKNIFQVVQLPLVALKHISTIGNFSSIHAPDLVSGMLHMSDPQFKAFLDSTHILAYTNHDFMARAMNGGSSAVAKMTDNPTAGQVFFASYHMPFFDYVRSKQLSFGASVGWTVSQNWAKQAMKGSRIAIANLKEMGIDPNEVIRQGGVLNKDQLRKGVFHFVNNRLFMDKTIEQSLYSNRNMIMRSATMYHTFVNAQSRFMFRELSKMVKARDYIGIAQFAGTIGVLWPAIAPMVKSVELYARTLNAKASIASAQQDYSNLSSGDPRKVAGTYLNLLSYYAAFGVYTNYISAAHGDRLAYAMLGPSLGVPARYASDALNLVTRTDSLGRHNATPVVRDTLEDFVPIAGNILAHQIAPTTTEEKAGQTKRPARPHRDRESAAQKRWKF